MAATSNTDKSVRIREAYLRTILDTAVDAIIVIDTKGIIEIFNRAAVRIFGYESADVVGRSVNQLMPEPYSKNHDSYIHRYLKTGKAHIIGFGREITGKRKDGSVFPMDLAVSEVILDEHRAFVGIVRDLSDRKSLEEALVMASENERRIIGQDLHDVLAQQLTGLSLLTKSLQQKMAKAGLPLQEETVSISELSRDALNEARRLSRGLYPSELERNGLCSALEEFAESQSLLFKANCRYSGLKSVAGLSKVAELHLFRIAQEAVNNSIKHSGGNMIRIDFTRDGKQLALSVEDNGKGFNPKEIKGLGMGLRIMRYRTSMLGGTLTMGPGKHGGTMIRCCIKDSSNATVEGFQEKR